MMIRESPYFFENSTPPNIWVCAIYKKTLVTLGIKIIKSALGGTIGHFDTTSWCFLISPEDKEKIKKEFEKE